MAHQGASSMPTTVRYAEPDYWEARYQREPALFEWFFGHTALRRIIRTYLSKKKPILHIGCGTSNLQEGMARSGYTIINTDISEVVIKQMQERHKQYTNMTYRIADCRNMPEFSDCSFGHVLDKGTMDALLCCKQGTENVMQMLMEIFRVLQPGGSFLLITLGDPSRRLPLLCNARLGWKVTLLLLPKISAANQAYVDGKPINDSTEPVEAEGPFEVVDPDTIVGLPPDVQFTNFFFIYACKKQPLQLPQHQGQKGQLPNGWVNGSKELFQKLQKELGLPEDLLDKGRRKRVMHVPASTGAQGRYGPISSGASAASGTSSPLSLAALPGGGGDSSALPTNQSLEHTAHLQSALTALQLQQLQPAVPLGQPPTSPNQVSSTSSMGQRDIPPRPQSAPNLVAISEAAARAEAVDAAALPAVLANGQEPSAGQPAEQNAAASPMCSMTDASPGAAEAVGASAPAPISSAVQGAGALPPTSACTTAGFDDSMPAPATPAAAAAATHAPPRHPLGATIAEEASQLHTAGTPLRVHAISGPAQLAAGVTLLQEGQGSAGMQQQQQPQPIPGATRVINFAAPPASATATCSRDAHASAAVDSSVVDSSTLPPLGPPKAAAVASTPTSPASTSPSHVTSTQQQPAVWPGVQLQQGQVLPQLQGQQAFAVSAAAAAGMFTHAAAPRGGRAPRLRRFSTEYGALSGSALQMQLEQLRLIQAQHSESAADGLVLHDVAATDTSGAAAAAAAVASAAWGSVRRSRDRRPSNLSLLSGLSIMSSASIDESGEDFALDAGGSTAVQADAVASSLEPSCHLRSPAPVQAVETPAASSTPEVSTGAQPVELTAEPRPGSS